MKYLSINGSIYISCTLNRYFLLKLSLWLLPLLIAGCREKTRPAEVAFGVNREEHRVDVIMDGKLFTSYLCSPHQEKPFLFPVMSAGGEVITRGYPLEPRAMDRVDHPHHVGIWFNYGAVNGFDFWNNSDAVPPERKAGYGRIRHIETLSTEVVETTGILIVKTLWTAPDNDDSEHLLSEKKEYRFSGDKNSRTIDHISTLTALSRDVLFSDSKEGLFAIRLERAFEFPSESAVKYLDEQGNLVEEYELYNSGVTGRYRNSEGIGGLDCWGKRARWVRLDGEKNGRQIAVIIFDHPGNPGFPAYWMSRGYGLFAINNLGQKIYSEGREELNLMLRKGETAVFKHRLMIVDGFPSDEAVERFYEEFIGLY